MTDSTPRRSIVFEPSPGGRAILAICDCGSSTLLLVKNAERMPYQQESAFTCKGCQTPHWFTVGPAASGDGSPS